MSRCTKVAGVNMRIWLGTLFQTFEHSHMFGAFNFQRSIPVLTSQVPSPVSPFVPRSEPAAERHATRAGARRLGP